MSAITQLTLTAVRDKLATKALSAEEATRACLDRIAATEPKIRAILHLDGEAALATAKAMDAAGPDPKKRLWGVPVLVKDAICVKDAPTTCASKILQNFVPFYDATSVEKLKAAGAVILGKTNMDEFAMGSSTENSAYQVTSNPWDLTMVPGGSSGGSAAAVSARQCFAALGTDTGGSIRQPAAFCGTVGLKPTYGRVSRYGLVAYGSSLDQIGPLTRTAEDAAAILSVIAGHDDRDSTSAPRDVPDFEAALAGAADLSGLTLGLPEEYWDEGVDDEVRLACRQARGRGRGARRQHRARSRCPIPPMPWPPTTSWPWPRPRPTCRASTACATVSATPEAQSLEDLYELSRTKGFGPEVQRRIVIGTYVLSAGYYDAYYRKAAQVRRLIRQDFLDAFQKCDVICGPTSPFVAYPIGQMAGDPLQMYLSDIFHHLPQPGRPAGPVHAGRHRARLRTAHRHAALRPGLRRGHHPADGQGAGRGPAAPARRTGGAGVGRGRCLRTARSGAAAPGPHRRGECFPPDSLIGGDGNKTPHAGTITGFQRATPFGRRRHPITLSSTSSHHRAIAVAVSGGSDSLLALALLRRAGHDVIAVHAHFCRPTPASAPWSRPWPTNAPCSTCR